ncbi:DEAD-box ATP-dependent RNA helicase CshA [Ktedonobacter sp. SOSP1-52]|uniref:DEAD/DEAH box helicase n=1 Tax=Ktedonobacter sp. SOSP1-52 TaxID=2778366 RepID=UPI0019152C09|nr:DEAD/DEAH box helicase [Ktedonobacter sp. SOSP1-52]GHO64483.1 DEAD-box ATP-dependent RNA helicase CshA [Ktedonobacter sp. SOSP1-52]
MPSFQDLPLQPATRAVLASMQITEQTPIQAEAIPALLAGKDVIGQSATGSGKTLAYGIPLIERLAKNKRVAQALVLVPTRELAVQVNSVLSTFAAPRRLTTALLVGGRRYEKQISALRYGAQIIIGTPGRIKDHLEQGNLVLRDIRICVLDEADQMLDSGFGPEIEQILETSPEDRQMALFSATMPTWIAKLQEKFLKDPVKVTITPEAGTQSTIEQIAYQVPRGKKVEALCTLLGSTQGEISLIFGRTKMGVERLGEQLSNLGFAVGTFHGDKSQRAREDVLMAFRRGQVQMLLATDVAARGLDIRGITQVINYELPDSDELFTHRIGRTGRMGRYGKAVTLLAPADMSKWRRMSRSFGQPVAVQKMALNDEAALARPMVMSEGKQARDLERDSEQALLEDEDTQVVTLNERPRRERSRFQETQRTYPRKRPYERMRNEFSARKPERSTDTFADAERPARSRVRHTEVFVETEGQAHARAKRAELFIEPELPARRQERRAATFEKPSTDKTREYKRGTGKPSSFGRGEGKGRKPAFSSFDTRPGKRTSGGAARTRDRISSR